MQILFQMDAQNDQSDSLKELFLSDKAIPQQHREYITELFSIVKEHLSELDETINRHSEKWTTQRMPKPDLAILRLATAEILYSKDIPDAVSIDEAVEMSKKFGCDSSHKFVNGVLGNISKEVSSKMESPK